MFKIFSKKRLKAGLSWILVASLLVGLIPPGIASAEDQLDKQSLEQMLEELGAATPTDIQGHWAEKSILDWVKLGLVEGYQDGSFRPNQIISRIEFVTLVNRAFAFIGGGDIRFSDVPTDSWSVPQVKAAVEAGYIAGYKDGTFRPGQQLLRVEAAVMLSRLVPVIVRDGEDPLGRFKDKDSVPGYGYDSLNAILESGYIQGFKDQTVRPLKPITRAEAVVMLDRLLQESSSGSEGKIVPGAKALEAAGTYGPQDGGNIAVAGALTVQAPGTTLRNMTIQGDLVIAETVGDGDVFLNHVAVLGKTFVRGGGENSVHVDDSNLGTIVIEKKDGRVRVVVGGTTVIEQMDIQSEARVESNGTDGSRIEGISISSTGEVMLSGIFDKVEINSDVELTVSSGTIADMRVNESVTGSTITLDSGVRVANLELHGTTSVKGEGSISKAIVDAQNIDFEKQPDIVEVTDRGGNTGGGGAGVPSFPNNPTQPTPTPTPTPTASPTPVPTTSPTPTPVPTTEPAVSVGLMVTQADETGIRVALNPAVADLSGADFILKDGANMSVAITFAGTLDGGSTYRLSSTLAKSSSYTLTASKTGYDFGSAFGFQVPGSNPNDISVAANVYGISETGFTVSLNGPVPGLITGNIKLMLGGNETGLTVAQGDDDGSFYTVSSSLTAGKTYALTIAQTGYDFGAPVSVVIPGTVPEDIVVAPAASQLSTAGFVLNLDQPVPELELDSFIITDSGNEQVGVDMLADLSGHQQFEIYASLEIGETYSLSLNKAGYTFDEPLVLNVEAIPATSTVNWVSFDGFSLGFAQSVAGLTAGQIELEDASGTPVPVNGLQLGTNGKSGVVSAVLTAGQSYGYRIVAGDYLYEGSITVPATIPVSKYTVFESVNNTTVALIVRFSVPVPGLTADAFHLTNANGTPYAISSVSSIDGGSSYRIVPVNPTNSDYKLLIEHTGYSFGNETTLIKLTLNPWTRVEQYPLFFVGFNPNLPVSITTDMFKVTDEFGATVDVKGVQSDQGGYVISYDGIRGKTYNIAVVKEGYDFGAPRSNTASIINKVITPSRTGFTLTLNPVIDIDTTTGFKLNRYSGGAVGAPVAIQSVTKKDNGGNYEVAASLTPGEYWLEVDAPLEITTYYFTVGIVATISVDKVVNTGLTVNLDYAVNGLDASSFVLTDTATGYSVYLTSAVTQDQGRSYRISAVLPGGNYVLRLNGHLPTAGVPFQVQSTLDVGTTTVSNLSNTGFDLSFDQPVPGLLPANLDIRDDQNNRLNVGTISTTDGGAIYRVNVNLLSGRDYTLTLNKDFVTFDAPVTFHVRHYITGSITEVTEKGSIEVRLSPALPQAEGGGLIVTDQDGTIHYPIEYAMSGGGAAYRFRIQNPSPLGTYQIGLNTGLQPLEDYVLNASPFTIPSIIDEVTNSTATGLTVRFDMPVAGLTKTNFVIRGASGATIPVSSATTSDAGNSYVLTAALPAGQFYTVQYVSKISYQTTTPVEFVVQNALTPTIGKVTSKGFKLQFAVKVAGLIRSEIVLRDPNGAVVGYSLYDFSTKDQGLSYDFKYFSGPGGLEPGAGYTLELTRKEFALAAPVTFDIPVPASVLINSTNTTDVIITVGSNGTLPELDQSNFELRDINGNVVPFGVTNVGSGSYRLTGAFDSMGTYTLVTRYPGFDFGAPLTFGLRIAVGLDTMFQSQQGFRLFLSTAIPDLSASEITVKDAGGNTTTAQSATTTDNGATYQVQIPLSGGKTYTVAITKPNYVIKYSNPFKLNKRTATVDRKSLNGFRLNFDRALSLSSADKISVVDGQGTEAAIHGSVSWDNGLSYEISVELQPDVNYSVIINRPGDDFGSGIPVTVKQVEQTFGGMEPGSGSAFKLTFDEPIPVMRVGEFELRRASDGRLMPLVSAESSDGGESYTLTAEFWESERYTIVPAKDGYYFGDPIAFTVPIIERTAVIGTGPKEISVGFNPAVPGLDVSNIILLDANDQWISVSSVVTEDGGATYRIEATFRGGDTYKLKFNKAGYDFGSELSADIPSSIVSTLKTVSETGVTVGLSPAVNGLSANDFVLRDSDGQVVALTNASTEDGGRTYTLTNTSALTGGENYTLTITYAGYDFGSALNAYVPIVVGATYAGISDEGFTIQLEQAVPGLSKGNVIVLDSQGVAVAVDSVTTTNGGLTYSVEADLDEAERYSVRLTESGCDFGIDANLLVPDKVGMTIDLFMTNGFTIKLDEAVNGLTAGSLKLTDAGGAPAKIVSWKASEDGLSYQVGANLTGHENYALQLVAEGYDFGAELQLKAQPVLVLSAKQIGLSGFQLDLGDSVPYMNPSFVHFAGSDGVRIPLDTGTFYDSSTTAHLGRVYSVLKPLTPGVVYTIMIEDPAHPAEAPLEVLLPLSAGMQLADATKGRIDLTFNRSVVGLLPGNFTLLTEEGDPVAIDDVVAGATETSWSIVTKLTENRTYTLAISKKGYNFGASGEVSVIVPIQVKAEVLNANELGFTIVLSEPVPNLDIALFKDDFIDAYYDLTITTLDQGFTYNVGVSWPSDYPLTLTLGKTGYDLGDNRTVQYEKKKPQLLSAVSSADGGSVVMTFDSNLISMGSDAGFAVKVNGQWRSKVQSVYVNQTTVKLVWTGPVLQATDEVFVAYTGVNRVRAVNGGYLAQFSEIMVANTSSDLGMVQSHVGRSDPGVPIAILHDEYGYSVLEAAKLMKDGGFSTAQFARAIVTEYGLGNSDFLLMLYALGTDPATVIKAINSVGFTPYPYYAYEWIDVLMSAGYTADDVAPVLRNKGYQIRDILRAFKQEGVNVAQAAQLLSDDLNEASGVAIAQLKVLYDLGDAVGAIQEAYELDDAETVKALAAGGVSAIDASAVIQELYGVDAVANVELLREAGYSAESIGAAIRQGYQFTDAIEAVRAFLGAGLETQDVYKIASGIYSPSETAVAFLLGGGLSAYEVVGMIRASGDGVGVAIASLRQNGLNDEAIAQEVMSVWGASLTLKETANEFVQSGMSKETTASLLHYVYGADVTSAFAALEPMFHPWGFDPAGLFVTLLKGGYDPKEVTDYFLKHVYAGRGPVLKIMIQDADYPIADALSYLHDAVTADGTVYAMSEAVKDIFAAGTRYSAADTLNALRTAYAEDENVEANADNLIAGMREMYAYYDYSRALIDQLGLTMAAWIELQTANCPCDATKLAKDMKFLFGNARIEDIIVAMSSTDNFTLEQIIEGTIMLFGVERAAAMPALTSVLRNTGYPISDIAAVYEAEGWTEWIKAFSKYGIAAREVATYLISKGSTGEQIIISRLAPYPLKDIALVLREQLEMEEAEAIDALVAANFYDEDEIGQAVAWAYGGNPVALWIRTLKAQGATALSVIYLLSSHYPEYSDASVSGPALVKGGYSMDEVMQALIKRSSNSNLQNTIAVLKQLFSDNQVSIAQLLTASSNVTPESGIAFLKNAKYSLYNITRSLKEHYGLDAGTAAKLLADAYANDLTLVIQTVADVYGQSKESAASSALEAEGITTLVAAIPYLRDAGFGLKDIARIAKNHFGATIGDVAQQLSAGSNAGNGVLIQAVADAFGQTIEHAIHELLAVRGQTSFAQAIAFLYAQQQFSLTTGAKLAKAEYGLKSGEALREFRAFGMYTDKNVVDAIAGVYGITQSASVVDSLTSSGYATLAEAVSYLLRMNFDLRSIIRVGKDHYGLNQGQVAAALETSGYYDGDSNEVTGEIADIYEQTMNSTIVAALAELGMNTFEEVLPELHARSFPLADIILAARDEYELTAGEMLKALIPHNWYSLAEVMSGVSEYYGKPIEESLTELLSRIGAETIAEAAPMMRGLGYSLKEIVTAAKEYYGLSAERTIADLTSLNVDSASIIEMIVATVYEQDADTGASEVIENGGDIEDPAQAAAFLRNAGISLAKIVSTLKAIYGQSPTDIATILASAGLFDKETIVYQLTVGSDRSIDSEVIEILSIAGADTAAEAADYLRRVGYDLEDITKALKNEFAQSESEATTILMGLNVYPIAVVEPIVEQVYGEDSTSTPADLLNEILDLQGITTAAGAVTFFKQMKYSLKDITRQLKNRYHLDSNEATNLLSTSYSRGDITLAIAAIYYEDTNLSVLEQVMTGGYASAPSHVANQMSGKFRLSDIALAMKVLFNLNADEAMDAMINVAATSAEIYNTVKAVYGTDPLYARLAEMKAKGKSFDSIVAEMRLRGKLDINSDYLVDTLDALGYDDATILNTRYNYFRTSNQNAGSTEEQAALLVRFGVNSPEAIVSFLLSKSYGVGPMSAYPIMSIIRAALPQAKVADIATAMVARGFHFSSIVGALDIMRENNGQLADRLKALGFRAPDAVNYLDDFFSLEEQIRSLNGNGYKLVEYISYVHNWDNDAVSILKGLGFKATDIAVAFFNSGATKNFATIAIYLRDGGYPLEDIIAGVMEAGCRSVWVLDYLTGEVGTTREIAKAMIDSGYISLTDTVTALEIAGIRQQEIYYIIQAYSTKAQEEFLNELSFAERKLLDGDDVRVIVTASTLRSAGWSAGETAEMLAQNEYPQLDWMMAAVLLVVAGYDVGDVTGAVWDAYRAAIGVAILQVMVGKAIGSELAQLKNYWTLTKIVLKIVKKTLK
ncbi:S-layer homology domain-containing protein [Cohnella lupini]|uniref:S-layer family protein n=1 Tax=Cohnella lupini TaxID=1294267 RepID=A0A3D9HSZ3_9BACL|nr:S-layer homology domain-containing protein [Cohnella lupini]RED52569.1 S-layer family protein [Cohnella lupini]